MKNTTGKTFDEKFGYIADCIDRDTLSNYLTIKKTGKEHLQDIKDFIKEAALEIVGENEKLYTDVGLNGHDNTKLIIRNSLRQQLRERVK